MKRTPLRRKTPLRRTRIDRRRKRNWSPPRIPPEEAHVVAVRDQGCIAAKYDASHVCFGRLTWAHVPVFGKNAYGKKPPDNRYHLVMECLGANSGGLQPWSELNHHIERAHLAKHYGPPPYPGDEE